VDVQRYLVALRERSLVHASIASAREALTCVVVHARGFHITVIGTPKPSAIAPCRHLSVSGASPSKSSSRSVGGRGQHERRCIEDGVRSVA